MVTALYRRYRPENFAEMIGQSQVTDPLMTALRTDRVNHAYLFSGPRGCGKTTSARILARCLNCAEGPTPTPCGVCASCVELSRDGSGSLDVVEIDAASHGGVDDARDLRERAIFAPARDRFKIFIIDEAHMVTSGGFNALLKIVEEPPEHVKFIFATTEPDKVIGTIRSRTHHYPFRLIPPAQLLEYVQQLCDSEGVSVAPGVLPLVVRAGGGSARDTLSLLDQLIAGSEGDRVEYERAVALLGYTHGALLDEVVDALAAADGRAAFEAVDRVIQTGQDPRRFVEDLLERLRDVIVVAATREHAAHVLRGVPADEIEGMRRQAAQFGHAELSRVADIVNEALTEMTGATSPRLHLELMVARALVPAADETARGALARVERLERRVGVEGGSAAEGLRAPAERTGATGRDAVAASPAPTSDRVTAPVTESREPVSAREVIAEVPVGRVEMPRPEAVVSVDETAPPAAPRDVAAEAAASWSVTVPGSGASSPSPAEQAASGAADSSRSDGEAPLTDAPRESMTSGAESVPGAAESAPSAEPAVASAPAAAPASRTEPGSATEPAASRAAGPVTLQQLRDAWPEILDVVQNAKRSAWLVVYTAQVRALEGDILTLAFPSEADVASFKQRTAGEGVSEYLRQAIVDVLGLRVKYIARVDSSLRPAEVGLDGGVTDLQSSSPADAEPQPPVQPAPAAPESASPDPAPASAKPASAAPVSAAPASASAAPASGAATPARNAPAAASAEPAPAASAEDASSAPSASAPAGGPSSDSPAAAPARAAESSGAPASPQGSTAAAARPASAGDLGTGGWTVPGVSPGGTAAEPEPDDEPLADEPPAAPMLREPTPQSDAALRSLLSPASALKAPPRPADREVGEPTPESAQDAERADAPAPESAAQRPAEPQKPDLAPQQEPPTQQARPAEPQRPAQQARPEQEHPTQPQRPTQQDRPAQQPPAQQARPQQERPAQQQRPPQTQQRPQQEPSAGDRRPAGQNAPQARPTQASTTTWDVVAIPSGPDDDGYSYPDEPMPSDEPDLPADLGYRDGSRADVPPQRPAQPQSGAPQPPRPAQPQSGATQPQPSASAPSAAPGTAAQAHGAAVRASGSPVSPPRGPAASRHRYGESVVREILQASFIEEQPLPGKEG
ncbi:DNA polymerase III subunit gamma and tau [Cnuibacter physcomitrellae]|uniref:DNA polymerase III subunit gamma and tau n=1 Tax=Cnuibacter physcomitrellae TaxID=1619308 RepID=UPI002175A0FF|nr:DNA polymerase III subunit gamma and tau [Cnuibacter physcomitrellae]MCS5496065.1 DNA polymerase III subunit gamma and tau [Cnuibacter physcomitrellae]